MGPLIHFLLRRLSVNFISIFGIIFSPNRGIVLPPRSLCARCPVTTICSLLTILTFDSSRSVPSISTISASASEDKGGLGSGQQGIGQNIQTCAGLSLHSICTRRSGSLA